MGPETSCHVSNKSALFLPASAHRGEKKKTLWRTQAQSPGFPGMFKSSRHTGKGAQRLLSVSHTLPSLYGSCTSLAGLQALVRRRMERQSPSCSLFASHKQWKKSSWKTPHVFTMTLRASIKKKTLAESETRGVNAKPSLSIPLNSFV